MSDYKLVLFLVLFSLLVHDISSSVNSTLCFFGPAETLVKEYGGLTELNCKRITNSNSTARSNDSQSDDINGCNCGCERGFQFGNEKEKFELSTGLGINTLEKEIIVLNVTISHVTFHKLSIRHQDLANKSQKIYWQTIEFPENHIPEKIFLFFSLFEYHKSNIQFFAEGKDCSFFKEYHFIPNSVFDKDQDNQILAYVDTTHRNKVFLHVQPHVNITNYLVKFHRAHEIVEAFCGPDALNISANDLPFEQNDFPEDAYYEFCLTPVHKNGTKYPTTLRVASFYMQSCEKLFIMIVGYGSIPLLMFVTFYILYIIIKYLGPRWMKDKRSSCLLVYSPTHDAHIDVLIELTEYLKECKINAMIDVLDIPNEAHKNPIHWYDSAFERANTIVVVASPRCKNTIVTKSIYRSLGNIAMIKIHERRSRSDKRYLALQLPYCKESDLPKEASAFTRLKIPKDLKTLVNEIHGTKYTEVFKTPNGQKLIDCIEAAKESILYDTSISKPKSLEKLTDLVFSRINESVQDVDEKEESIEDNTAFIAHESKANKIQYATNIMDLDLLRDGKS